MKLFDSILVIFERIKILNKSKELKQKDINNLRKEFNSKIDVLQNNYINDLQKGDKNKIKQLENLIGNLEKLIVLPKDRNVIFVEGKTDKIIFEKIIKYLGKQKDIKIVSCDSVDKMPFYAVLWGYKQSKEATPYKGVFLMDDDEAGAKNKKQIDSNIQKNKKFTATEKIKVLEDWYSDERKTEVEQKGKVKVANKIAHSKTFEAEMAGLIKRIGQLIETHKL